MNQYNKGKSYGESVKPFGFVILATTSGINPVTQEMVHREGS